MFLYCVFGMTCTFVIRSLRASDCWVVPGVTRNGAQPASYSTILLGCRGKRKLLLYCWFIAILTSQRRVLLPVFPCQFAHRRQEKCSNRIKVLLLVDSSFCLNTAILLLVAAIRSESSSMPCPIELLLSQRSVPVSGQKQSLF